MSTGRTTFADLHPWRVCVGVQAGSLVLDWPACTHPLLRRLGEACLAHNRLLRPTFTRVSQMLGQIEASVRAEGISPPHHCGIEFGGLGG